MRKATASDIEKIICRPYTVELDYGETPEDGVAAYVVDWPGCITAGATRAEALARIGDAMYDWVEGRLKDGLEIPEPMKEYGGTVVVKMPRMLHRDAARRARHEGVSMNQWISTTVARAIGTPQQMARSRDRRRARTAAKRA